jgi:hypothetical protein
MGVGIWRRFGLGSTENTNWKARPFSKGESQSKFLSFFLSFISRSAPSVLRQLRLKPEFVGTVAMNTQRIFEKLENRFGTETTILIVAICTILLKTLGLGIIFYILYLCLKCWVF